MIIEEPQLTKLTLTIGDTTTSWEVNATDCSFDTILNGFLGCMWSQTFVPGTEMHVFQDYIEEMQGIYADKQDDNFVTTTTWDLTFADLLK